MEGFPKSSLYPNSLMSKAKIQVSDLKSEPI